MPYAFKMDQLTPEWWEVRRGVPTSSEFSKIITPAKGDLSTSADDYICELIGDLIMQTPAYFSSKGTPSTPAMRTGQVVEPEARCWYEFANGCTVDQVGFVMDDEFRFGCSPDGFVGLKYASEKPSGSFNGHPFWKIAADLTLEIKSPTHKVQAKRLLTAEGMSKDYKPQVHGHLVVCDTPAADWVSFSNGFDGIQVHVDPDEYTAKVRAALEGFWEKFEKALKRFGMTRNLPQWGQVPEGDSP